MQKKVKAKFKLECDEEVHVFIHGDHERCQCGQMSDIDDDYPEDK